MFEFERALYDMTEDSSTSGQYAFSDPTRAALKSYEGSIFHLLPAWIPPISLFSKIAVEAFIGRPRTKPILSSTLSCFNK